MVDAGDKVFPKITFVEGWETVIIVQNIGTAPVHFATVLVLLCYKQHFDVELFRGFEGRARPATAALCGIYRGPGQSRRARRQGCSTKELLHGLAVTRGAQERGTDGRSLGAG